MRPDQSPDGALRVLVVDDNRDATDTFVMVLALWGYRALSAYDGGEGLAAALAHRPDVVLLDVELPTLDGCEVARRIRADPAAGGAMLVAVTGYARDEDRRRAHEAGFDHYLVKPVEPAELLRLLQGCRPTPDNSSSNEHP
jgi:CheY-like chemotaxis protein